MLIRHVEVDGTIVDVLVEGARIAAVGPALEAAPGDRVVEGRGGALLPGLHDHHIHLYALAAARLSVRCGPPDVASESELTAALGDGEKRLSDPDAWLRGVGYHESVAGALDARDVDRLVPDHSARIQHRSGAMWILNHRGLAAIGLGGRLPPDTPPGVERDAAGRATGRLLRVDDWLRERLAPRPRPDLAAVGAELARYGVSGVTDATPGNDDDTLSALAGAIENGALRQHLRLMGRPDLATPEHPRVSLGAVKLVLNEYEPMDFSAVEGQIREAHDTGRPVAIHCVTRAELALALGAFEAAGCTTADRIEHASVAPPELAARIAGLGLCVVTQPNFVRERGDAYRRDVDEVDRPWLYRCRGLLEAGVSLGAGTDAPFGDPDPWRAMQAALDRRTAAGETLGEKEALTPERALGLFTSPAESPGAPSRRIAPGEPADLCLLARPWSQVRDTLSSVDVVFTASAGVPTWQRDPS